MYKAVMILKRWPVLFLLFLTFLVLLANVGRSQVIITEFAAVNSNGLKDEDGAFSDWIELFNQGTTNVNLDGWFLTDSSASLTKWRIPATNIGANTFLIVFASGKNRATPGLPLHANFGLSASGEYLALVKPDGVTVASEFSPVFPEQFPNVSYGIGQNVQV
ncbi:MAG: Spore coat protein CotH, partial [Verrucomicrobiales bacterium]|nr:Spore coat protein CotH [Verrucomicrobiales bacterium]